MGKLDISRLTGPDPIRTEIQRDVANAGKEAALRAEKTNNVTEDKLDISSRAAEVGRLVEHLKTLPDVRQDNVTALKEQIAIGQYRPSAQNIADAILKDETS